MRRMVIRLGAAIGFGVAVLAIASPASAAPGTQDWVVPWVGHTNDGATNPWLGDTGGVNPWLGHVDDLIDPRVSHTDDWVNWG